jgi:hypothetical protein
MSQSTQGAAIPDEHIPVARLPGKAPDFFTAKRFPFCIFIIVKQHT